MGLSEELDCGWPLMAHVLTTISKNRSGELISSSKETTVFHQTLSINLSFFLIYLSIYIFIYLSTYLSIYLSNDTYMTLHCIALHVI